MSRRMWTGILAGLLGVIALAGVAGVAYNIGRDDKVVRTVGDGEVVRVVGHGWGHGYGPGPGFFLFPLLLFGLIVLLLWGARGRWGGWGGGGRPPWGGGPWAHGGPEGAFAEWHRRAHSQEPGTATAPPPPGAEPGETGPPPPTV
jgi:hypothetical protein